MTAFDQTPAGGVTPPETIPVPMGTRDVLPEEMAELRAISARALDVFAQAGYGEVATPALELESTMQLAGPSLLASAYRVPDNDGQFLTLRFDSTIPIARLAATRYAASDGPLRFCYMQHVYRAIEPKRAQSRQFLQIGMELLGVDAPQGDAETVAVLVKLLEAAGLTEFKIALGDVAFFDGALSKAGASEQLREGLSHELHTRDLVGFKRKLAESDLAAAAREDLLRIASARGGRELLEREGAEQLLDLDSQLAATGVADRVIYDLGLVRELDYYTGMVLEIYAPSSGFALGGGGRYDRLVGCFGRELAASGFSLNMERLHLAILAEAEGAA